MVDEYISNCSPNTVWLIHAAISTAAEALPGLGEHLSTVERSQANRFRTTARQRTFIVSRGLLREILGRVLAMPPKSIPLSVEAEGKPVLLHGDGPCPWHFNVSHSNDFILIAITRLGAVGVDVECQRRRIATEVLLSNYFSGVEQEQCRELAPNLRYNAVIRAWTRKEATWKVWGGARRIPFDRIEVSPKDCDWTDVKAHPTDARTPVAARCFTWQPSAGYIASAAVELAAQSSPRFHAAQFHFPADGDLSKLLPAKRRSR